MSVEKNNLGASASAVTTDGISACGADARHQLVQQDFANDWYQQWLCLCHESELPENGAYLTIMVGDFPIVVTRDETAGKIHVLNNSCRHRGSKVCQTHKGTSQKLVCPYHQWVYALDGALIYARYMEDEVDMAKLSLKPITHQIVDGFIYACLSPAHANNQPQWLVNGSDDKHSATVVHKRKDYHVRFEFITTLNQSAHATLAQLQSTATEAASNAASNASAVSSDDSAMNLLTVDIDDEQVTCQLLVKVFPQRSDLTQLVVQGFVPLDEQGVDKQMFVSAVQRHLGVTDIVESSVTVVNAPDVELKDSVDRTLTINGAIDPLTFYSPERIWNADNESLICSMIIDETPNVKTFTFRTRNGSWFNYKPGQFITLALPTSPEPLLRTYTLVSTPSRPTSISITAKLQPDGGKGGTKWLFDNLKVGDEIKAYGPNGRFSFFDQPAQKYLFLSAGSGITPMMSMVRWMYDYGMAIDITMVACFQKPEDILFRTELERMAKRAKHLKLAWVVQSDETHSWTGYYGRFNKLTLGLTTPDYMERDIYCCGPEPFMQATREILHDSGFDLSRYYEESFFAQTDGKPLTTNHHDWLPDAHKTVNLQFSKSQKSAEAVQTQTLLETARTQQIAIPSACGLGVCGTCKVRVKQGETHMVHNGGISQKEIDDQYVLACCTYPLTDVEIDI